MTPDPHDEVFATAFATAFAEAFARCLDQLESRGFLPAAPPPCVNYGNWWNDRLRAEVKRVRLALAKTPGALAVPGVISDQTIVNLENGLHSTSIRNVAVLSEQLGTPFEALVLGAIRRG